jgi:hypothetical protein
LPHAAASVLTRVFGHPPPNIIFYWIWLFKDNTPLSSIKRDWAVFHDSFNDDKKVMCGGVAKESEGRPPFLAGIGSSFVLLAQLLLVPHLLGENGAALALLLPRPSHIVNGLNALAALL